MYFVLEHLPPIIIIFGARGKTSLFAPLPPLTIIITTSMQRLGFGRACNSEYENEKTTPSAGVCGAHKFGTDLDFFGRV